MEGLKDWEPNPEKRWKHILENQIFMMNYTYLLRMMEIV